MSEVIESELPEEFRKRIGVLSGPNHAEEVSRQIPSATVISALDRKVALKLQEIFMTPYFRVYTNPDIIGVELGGATKNVIAIAAGISDGLGYGDNTKASLMTRGLAEMTRLGVAIGARPLTFSGLSGVGDLIVTCTSRHSRNRAVGEKIGKGMTLEEVSRDMRMVAEGVRTSLAIRCLAEKHGVEMPITKNVTEVLYEGKDPHDSVSDLMTRGAKDEIELLQEQEWG
jgi:glycerol-3-phosphate dehydrogenase (NAD(P)+)